MDLSIIIVSYNTRKLTLDAIKSVIKDTSIKKKEIIVVDNGSTDRSNEAVRNFQFTIPNLRLIENNNNLGFSKANNQGIRIAKGKYILLLNSDTRVKKGSFKKLLDFAKKHPDAGVVGARLLNKDGSIQESCFNFPTIKCAINQYWLHKGSSLAKYTPKDKRPVEVDSVIGAAFLITPKALKKLGGLDERYFFYYEDLAYCREVRKKGLKVYYLPSAKVIHYHGASGKKSVESDNQWRRLIPSSKIYHGLFGHYVFNFILWSGQKWQKLTRN